MPTAKEALNYQPLVEIGEVEDFRSKKDVALSLADRRDGKLYRFTPNIRLCVNVALATGRPLLVLGASGCGKSSLAYNLAWIMNRRYYEYVVTSRSQARDLFYRFDAVRRLGDAQFGSLSSGPGKGAEATEAPEELEEADRVWKSYGPYVEPGPLWWILDRESAIRRGYDKHKPLPRLTAGDPAACPRGAETGPGAILLIDEIDKAEPDFPNNLLVPLGSGQFPVEELGISISAPEKKAPVHPLEAPFVIITSNRERELPEAFIRRCIVLEIPAPSAEELIEIGKCTFKDVSKSLLATVAKTLIDLRGKENVSIAEYLDAIRAIVEMKAGEPMFQQILERATWRQAQP